MSKKVNKIINNDYNLFPSNAEKFPSAFLDNSDTFVERWASIVRKSYNASGEDASKPVPGLVLAVKKNGKITPSGPRDRINSISEVESQTCLKMWVHTKFDSTLEVPENFINSDKQVDLIYEHFVFESQNEETDKIIPKPGDIVQVIHPWAWGFTSKVGLYLGKLAPGMAPTLEKTSDKFKDKNSRATNVPK